MLKKFVYINFLCIESLIVLLTFKISFSTLINRLLLYFSVCFIVTCNENGGNNPFFLTLL